MLNTPAATFPVVAFPVRHVIFDGESSMAAVIRNAERVAASNSTVLLTGETGTGKEVIARFIHEHSARRDNAIVPVNCGAIPEALLESELFGFVKGAFTGAAASRRGRVALAHRGTLFLDEIGEMPLQLQVKLLRLLQERTYEPVGSNESVSSDFRLIAATNKDLAAEVEAGRFRRDLYYRLFVCPIDSPALRHRPRDIPELFNHFWAARGESRPLEPAALAALKAYAWPGNVRELENLVERLTVLAGEPVIRLVDLPETMRSPSESGSARPRHLAVVAPPPSVALPPQVESSPQAQDLRRSFPINLPQILKQIEDEYIQAALEHSRGSRKTAAEMLGLQRTTLVEKLRRRQKEASAPDLAFEGAAMES